MLSQAAVAAASYRPDSLDRVENHSYRAWAWASVEIDPEAPGTLSWAAGQGVVALLKAFAAIPVSQCVELAPWVLKVGKLAAAAAEFVAIVAVVAVVAVVAAAVAVVDDVAVVAVDEDFVVAVDGGDVVVDAAAAPVAAVWSAA